MTDSILQAKLESLETFVSSDVLNRMRELITTSPPPALMKISPPRMATSWGRSRRELIRSFLHATRAGIFDMEWDIRCPSCKGSTQLRPLLSGLRSTSHCAYCQIDIHGGFDDAVEVTFRVNPSVRDLGEVSLLEVIRHNAVMENDQEIVVDPFSQTELKVELTPGTWHFFSEDFTIAAPVLVRGDEVLSQRMIELIFNGTNLKRLDTKRRRPGPAKVVVQNDSEQSLHLRFARAKEFPWVSGAEVACVQTFRDLFSTELIDADESFAVRSATFVFTDIKGSTAMYERLGDSEAYALVREHFRILQSVVQEHRGAVVKTIGDAIMAVFLTPLDGVRAVLDMQAAFEAFNEREQNPEDVYIKAGAHYGPCIAVTSNDCIDYFGRTVNITARVQGLSLGNDIMVSRELLTQTGVEELVENSPWRRTFFDAPLKGLAEAYPVVRLRREPSTGI